MSRIRSTLINRWTVFGGYIDGTFGRMITTRITLRSMSSIFSFGPFSKTAGLNPLLFGLRARSWRSLMDITGGWYRSARN